MQSFNFKRFLVTGGAGFIGSAFIRYGLSAIPNCEKIVNLDALTYAADLQSLHSIEEDERYFFCKGDICDGALVEKLCIEHQIDAIVHFAAQTHVDKSISGPRLFYETNVGGTLSILEILRDLKHIHLHHVSTDEVFGALSSEGYFTETSPYLPNSPYAASKAASDHFVRAYAHTYGLSTTISHCTNNYGPGQHLEKFIPQMIYGCFYKKPLPVYGNGHQVRDWIFVDDHARALWSILEKGKKSQTYAIGAGCEKRNIDLLKEIIQEFAQLKNIYLYRNNLKSRNFEESPCHSPDSSGYFSIEELNALITFTSDRPGHDFRYAIDAVKARRELDWQPKYCMSTGLQKTIAWYLERLTS